MDTFARGLKSAACIVDDGVLNGCVKVLSYSAESDKELHYLLGYRCLPGSQLCACNIMYTSVLVHYIFLQDRYKSYDSGIGAKIEQGETSFEELEVSICFSTIV